MAAFTISYRLPSGGLKSEVIDAADRASALAQMRSRGITPVSVKEGSRLASTTTPASRPLGVNGMVAGLFVVVAAVVVWFCLIPKEKPVVPRVEKPKKVDVEKPKKVRVEKPKKMRVEMPTPIVRSSKVIVTNSVREARLEKLRAMTPEQRKEFLLEEERQRPIDLTPSTNRVFRTGVEQVMAWIFTARKGNLPPPLPGISIRDEAHMEEILASRNPLLEGDSEGAKDAKQMVELAKAELRDYLKQGGDVKEFLQYYHGQLLQAHHEWTDAQRSVMKTIRDDPDIAAVYIDEVNKRLSAKGIKPVNIPPRIKQRLGIE